MRTARSEPFYMQNADRPPAARLFEWPTRKDCRSLSNRYSIARDCLSSIRVDADLHNERVSRRDAKLAFLRERRSQRRADLLGDDAMQG